MGSEGFAVDASLIRADANKQRSAEGTEPVDWDGLARTRRSVREYLVALDEAAWGAASEVTPKFISRSDPAARPVARLHEPEATAPRERDERWQRCEALNLVRQPDPIIGSLVAAEPVEPSPAGDHLPQTLDIPEQTIGVGQRRTDVADLGRHEQVPNMAPEDSA